MIARFEQIPDTVFYTVRTDRMAEIRICMTMNIRFNLVPIARIVSDFLA